MSIPFGDQLLRDGWLLPVTRGTAGAGPPIAVPTPSAQDLGVVTTERSLGHSGIRDALVSAVDTASRRVFVASWLLSDAPVVDALCRAAQRMKGGVYVITALAKQLHVEYPDGLDAEEEGDRASKTQQHLEQLRRLADAGVWLRSAEDVHLKLCVVDDAVAVLPSANLTPEALDKNPENGLVIRESSVVREYGRFFAHLFDEGCTQESPPGSQTELRTPARVTPSTWMPLSANGALVPVVTYRSHENSILKAALEVITSAREELVLSTYSIDGISGTPLGDAIKTAIGRLKRVTLLVRSRNHVREQRLALALFAAPDRRRRIVHVYGHPYTHAKLIAADGRRALLWSGNLEWRFGWTNGVELGVDVRDAAVASALRDHVLRIANEHPMELVVRPSLQQAAASGRQAPLTGDWTLELPAGVTDADWNAVTDGVRNEVVAIGFIRPKQILRIGNELLLDVNIDEDQRRLLVARIGRTKGTGPAYVRFFSRGTLSVVESRNMNDGGSSRGGFRSHARVRRP